MTAADAKKIIERWKDIGPPPYEDRNLGYAEGFLEGRDSGIKECLKIIQPFIDSPYTSDTGNEAENIKSAILSLVTEKLK